MIAFTAAQRYAAQRSRLALSGADRRCILGVRLLAWATRHVSLASHVPDVWDAAVQNPPKHGHGAMLMVERAFFGERMPTQRHFLNAPQTLRLILLDKTVLDLEAPFTGGRNAEIVLGGSVPGGIGIEDVMFSTAIRKLYQRHKPLIPGTMAQEISDPSYRRFVAVAESSQEKSDAVRVRRLTPNNMWGTPVDGLPGREAENLFGTDQGRAPTETLSSCHVLSGLPITRSLTVQSPAAHVKDAVCWLWGRQHITRDDVSVCIQTEGGTKQPILEAEVDGQVLMYAQPGAPRVRFAFSVDEYVLGDLEILVQGVPIKVFVNAGDSLTREQLREHPTTAGSIGKKKPIVQNLGGGMLNAIELAGWQAGGPAIQPHSRPGRQPAADAHGRQLQEAFGASAAACLASSVSAAADAHGRRQLQEAFGFQRAEQLDERTRQVDIQILHIYIYT